jgi:hypothetical protein
VSNPSRKGKSRAAKKRYGKRRLSASKSPPPTTLEILDRLFRRKMPIKIDGEDRALFAFQAILTHLLQKEIAGDKHASRILHKYQRLERRESQGPMQIAFADDDYTQSLTTPLLEVPNG